MNELKAMAIKAKSRLLNKGLRDIYSQSGIISKREIKKEEPLPSIDFQNDDVRKQTILNMIKNRI